jgi:glycine cleavage system aminomethyltransferase T/glycine/D-amino acid oxidase-like deaminating enzyme
MAGLPDQCEVVVVGGGVIGVSVAYHLADAGVTDVVLLERKELTSGTTWHAAGLVGQLRSSINMTQLARYTSELYRGLEAETGQATGYRQCGSIAEKYPLIQTDDLFGGIHIPSDGYANAVDITQALAKGAKRRGAQIFTGTKVDAILRDGDQVTGVRTAEGEIRSRYVVICGGMWSRDLASSVGVNLPLHACEHYYVLFEGVEGLSPELPVLRDYDACTYYKYDAGKLLVGAFEPSAKPWGMDGISEDFCFDEIAGDFDHFEPVLHDAMKRLPALERAGIQKFFCGPESFTPDVRYHLGEAPELKNCFVAAGLNSIGLQSAGGVGKVTAAWIRDGRPPVDLWEVDVRRNMPFQRNRQYLQSRVSESLGLLYATHFPFRQYETGRGVRKSAIHDRLVAAGACHGEAFGWERPNWYAPTGVEPVYEYSYGRQNWFEHSAAEHRAVREGVALFDQSSFAKFRLEGRDAAAVLNHVCANDIDVTPGRVVYTQWLNERGGIEADLTVTRLSDHVFMIVSAAETEVRDFYWLKRHVPDAAHCVLTNVTSAMGVISIMGPRSRELLQSLTPDDMSHGGFPFATSREIEMGYGYVRASRITFVGELGWELYIPTEFMQDIYDRIVTVGVDLGLVHAGYHALNSLRMEKAYRHWSHDITDEDSPLEAGLDFVIKFDKAGGFIGREALLAQRERGLSRRLLQLRLTDPAPLMYHNEPIWRDGELVGHITSGAYGHFLGGAVGLGYVSSEPVASNEAVLSGEYEVEVACERFAAEVSLRPLYDPDNAQIRR